VEVSDGRVIYAAISATYKYRIGIRRAATFKKCVRIAAVEGERDGYEQIQLRLVDQTADQTPVQSTSIMAHRKYGAIVPDRIGQESTVVDTPSHLAPAEHQLQTL
jgi:hypothetical protein